MNKKLAEWISLNGFQPYGENGFYGFKEGYQVAGEIGADTASSFVTVSCPISGKENEVEALLAGLKKSRAIVSYTYSFNEICIKLNSAISTGIFFGAKKLSSVDGLVRGLSAAGIPKDRCPYCGEILDRNATGEVQPVEVPGRRVFCAHRRCMDAVAGQEAAAVREAAQKRADYFANAPGNYGRGFLGALIGTVVGCVVWGLIYAIGFYASIIAVLIAYLSSFLWDKFGGKNDKVKIVCICVLTVVGIVVTQFAIYLLLTSAAMQEAGMEGNLFSVFISLMESNAEFSRAVWIDTVLALVFGVIGLIGSVLSMVKKQKKMFEA